MNKPLSSWKKRVLLAVVIQTITVPVLYLVPVLQQYVFVPGAALLCSILAASLGIEAVSAKRHTSISPPPQNPWRVVFVLYGKVVLWSLLLLVPIVFLLLLGQITDWFHGQAELVVVEKKYQLGLVSSFWENVSVVGNKANRILHFSLWVFGISAGLGSGVGIIVGLVWQRRRWAYVGLVVVLLASFLISGWKVLLHPTFVVRNPFWAYLFLSIPHEEHSLWESLRISPSFVLVRVQHLAWLLGSLALLSAGLDATQMRWRVRGWWVRKKSVFLLASLVILLPWAFQQLSGLVRDETALQTKLISEKETPHFVLHFDPWGPWKKQIEWVALEHEFRYHQLHQKLGTEPSWKVPWWQGWLGLGHSDGTSNQKISVYLLNNQYQSYELLEFYNKVGSFAKPWQKEFFLTHPLPFPLLALNKTLIHEMAHVFAGGYGDALFRISRAGPFPNISMIEGTAEALVGNGVYGQEELQQAVHVADLNQFSLERAFRPYTGIGQRPSSEIYTIAGSFCGYLAQQQGFASLMQVYKRGGRPQDFAVVYDKPFAALQKEWADFVQTQSPSPSGSLFRNYLLEYMQNNEGFYWRNNTLGNTICSLRSTEDLGRYLAETKVCEGFEKIEFSSPEKTFAYLLDAQGLVATYPEQNVWHLWAAWLLFQQEQWERCAHELDLFFANLYQRPMYQSLENWALFLQGNVLFRLEKFDQAQESFATLLTRANGQAINPKQVQMIQDWLERCRFASEYFKDSAHK